MHIDMKKKAKNFINFKDAFQFEDVLNSNSNEEDFQIWKNKKFESIQQGANKT